MTEISLPKISEILMEEFMLPMNISQDTLAKQIFVPTSRIQDLLHNRRQVTVDTSVRLGRFFGVSDRYFLNLQNDIDLRQAESKNHKEYAQIQQYQVS